MCLCVSAFASLYIFIRFVEATTLSYTSHYAIGRRVYLIDTQGTFLKACNSVKLIKDDENNR